VTTADRQPPHHNNSNCVKWYACKLPECKARFNARRRALRAGTAQPARILIDAEPVRQHILDLQDAGLTPTGIAHLAGLAHTTVWSFLQAAPCRGRGRKRYTTPETAAKILAVRPLTAIGALRRIQALAAIGWTVRKVAERAGVSSRWTVDLRPDGSITPGHALKIARAYEELRHQIPEKHGVLAGHARRSRERAAANRWPGPQYWADRMDVIDDPHFQPEHGLTKREVIAREAHWLMQQGGLDREAAAERLGVHKSYIDHALREHPGTGLEVAA
jgi:hypothetical protein